MEIIILREKTMHITRFLKWILACSVIFSLVACGGDDKKNGIEANTIRVGIMTRGTEEQLMDAVKKTAAKSYNLNIEVVPYTYAAELNKALSNHEIDANIFQYRAHLEYSKKKYGYHLSAVGDTFIYPMGIYSSKIRNILLIGKNAVIAIPNEPINEGRALFLLEKAGLIRMKNVGMNATTNDISVNPYHFQFRTLPAGELISVLPNVDAVVVNASFALSAGFIPSKNALVIENQNPAYSNIIVVREGEENDPRMKALVEIFHSPEIENAINEIFKGQAIPAWK